MSLLFQISCSASTHNTLIEQECIKAYKTIKKRSYVNKIQRAAVLTTVASSIGYLTYRLLNYKAEEDETGSLLYPSIGTLGWYYKVGILARDLFVAFACVDGGIVCTRKILKSFFHDDNLEWFIASHANIYDTYKQLEKLRSDERLEDVYVDANRRMYLQELSKELIAIDGFMRYKIENMQYNTEYAQLLESRLKHTITQLALILSDKVTRSISHEWEDIESVCNHFQQWERRQAPSRGYNE